MSHAPGDSMSLTSVERRRMSLDDFLALPDDVRAEYVDGEAIMTPPATWSHQSVAFKVALSLESALTDVVIAPEAGVRTHPQRFRIADVAVAETMPDGRFTEAPPLVVVEVLSPSTRSEDTVRKSHEYAAVGVGQYWIVDREAGSLTVFANNGSGWDVLLELDETHPQGSVDVGDHGSVDLDLVRILAS